MFANLPKTLSVTTLQAVIFRVSASSFPLVPDELQRSLPACALPCIEAGISDEFTPFVCPVPASLQCLCSRHTQAGPVLSDIAFRCYYSSCLNETASNNHFSGDRCATLSSQSSNLISRNPSSASANRVMASEDRDPFLDTADSGLPASITAPAETGYQSGLLTTAVPSETSAAVIPTSTVGPAATASPSATALSSPANLSPGSIAGITVGAVVLGVLAYIVAGSIVNSLRRRRQTPKHTPWAAHHPGPSRFGGASHAAVSYEKDLEGRRSPVQDRQNPLPDISTAYPKIMDPSKIGLAVSKEPNGDGGGPSPDSVTSGHSMNSMTQLLPTSPSKNLKIATQRFVPQRNPSERRFTHIEDDPQSDITVDAAQFPGPLRMQSVTVSTNPPKTSLHLPSEASRPDGPPSLKLAIPRSAAARPVPGQLTRIPLVRQSTLTIINDEPQSPTQPGDRAARTVIPDAPRTGDSMTTSRGYIPSYYMRKSDEPETPPEVPHLATSYRKHQRQPSRTSQRFSGPPPAPAPTRQLPPVPASLRVPTGAGPTSLVHQSKTPAPRDSTASATSIETNFSDDAAPPKAREEHSLTPIVEASPVTKAKYPKVPRPSNPSESRGPRWMPRPMLGQAQHQRSDSESSTLAVKRKGSGAADHLQKGLWVTNSHGKTETPINPERRGSDWPMRSTSRSTATSNATRDDSGRAEQSKARPNPKKGNGGDMVVQVH